MRLWEGVDFGQRIEWFRSLRSLNHKKTPEIGEKNPNFIFTFLAVKLQFFEIGK